MPARSDRLAVRALALLLPGAVLAQAPAWPTAQDMERALQEQPFPDAGRIGAQPVPRPPRITSGRPALDIESLARSGERIAAGTPASPPPPLRIFVTLEMPPASLRLLVDQAARSGSLLVLRGLKAQSLRVTLDTVRELIGERQVAWQIDPEAFTRYGVQHAPTFVLALHDPVIARDPDRCAAGCLAPDAFLSIAGDVSLDYALEAMRRQRPGEAPRIDALLKRLRAS